MASQNRTENTGSTTIKDPGNAREITPESPSAAQPARSPGQPFMSWMRQLDLRREPGWIGGVASGIATRLTIDPLIVRGVLVVVAILGGPAILLYAAAWLLLPDENDSIHLENLLRRKFDRAHAGIGALLLLTMLPTTQGFWQVGSFVAGAPSWGTEIFRALWTVAVIGGIIALVVWIARLTHNSGETSRAEPVVAPAKTADDPSTSPAHQPVVVSPPPAPPHADASDESRNAVSAAPTLPEHPSSAASDEEITAWREQRDIWKVQNAAWKAQQQADAQEIRRQRTAESRDRARAAAEIARANRRERERLNPRLPVAVMAIVSGLALLAYGIVAAASSSTGDSPTIAAATGLSVAALVFGFAIVIGGILRRRGAFLAFLAGMTVVAAFVAFSLPENRTLLGPTAPLDGTRSAQLWGTAYVKTEQNESIITSDLWQGAGDVEVYVNEGTAVTLDVRSPGSSVCVANLQSDANSAGFTGEFDCLNPTDRGSTFDQWRVTIGDPEATVTHTVHLWQQDGRVRVFNDNPLTATELEE